MNKYNGIQREATLMVLNIGGVVLNLGLVGAAGFAIATNNEELLNATRSMYDEVCLPYTAMVCGINLGKYMFKPKSKQLESIKETTQSDKQNIDSIVLE